MVGKIALLKYKETHLIGSERVDLACDYLVHEFRKLFSHTNTEALYETIRSLAPQADSSDAAIRDFWNLFCAMSSTWRLKDLHNVVTDENMAWAKEQIPVNRLHPQTPQGWMRNITPYSFDKAISFLESKPALEHALNDPEEYEKKHPSGSEDDPMIALENRSIYVICDGNGRLAHWLLRWVNTREAFASRLMTVWVGRRRGPTRNHWIPTGSLFFLKDVCSRLSVNAETLLGTISQLALEEYQTRVRQH